MTTQLVGVSAGGLERVVGAAYRQEQGDGAAPGPCCARETDAALVEEAALRIRAILVTAVSRGMSELGEYLLETFYGGDPVLYRSMNPRKHASLRMFALRRKPGQLISRSRV